MMSSFTIKFALFINKRYTIDNEYDENIAYRMCRITGYKDWHYANRTLEITNLQ